jgi:hypothetical protein
LAIVGFRTRSSVQPKPAVTWPRANCTDWHHVGAGMKLYNAIVWIREEPGVRVSVRAESLDDASRRLEAEYGKDTVVSLWDEEEAGRPR